MDYSPIVISIKTAVLATILTFFSGISAARLVKRMPKLRGFLDGVFTLPMVLPPTVVGFFLLIFLGRNGPFSGIYERTGYKILFSFPATVISASVVSFPLMYRTALGAFDQVNEDYIYAARTLGFTESKIFRKVIFKIAEPGLISGVVLSFARALGEFGATIMIAGNIPGKTQNISMAIYSFTAAGNRQTAYFWCIISIVLSFCFMFPLNLLTSAKRRH